MKVSMKSFHIQKIDLYLERISENKKKLSTEFNVGNIQFRMFFRDIPKFEQLSELNKNVFQLRSINISLPLSTNKNFYKE